MGRCNKKFGLLSLLIMLIFAITRPTANTATLTSNWTTTTPTIDGSIASGEWDDAYANSLYLYSSSQVQDLQLLLWAMNDNASLYLRCQWTDSTYGGSLADPYYSDQLSLLFDEQNDGNWSGPGVENAFDLKIWDTGTEWTDGYTVWANPPINPDVGPKNGLANFSWTSGTYVVEISMPIGSSDAEDLQPNAGAVMGIVISIWDFDATKNYIYPLTAPTGATVTFQLAAAPVTNDTNGEPPIGTPVTFIVLLISIVGFAFFTVWTRDKEQMFSNVG